MANSAENKSFPQSNEFRQELRSARTSTLANTFERTAHSRAGVDESTGARAIEVVALFDDQVQTVKHLTDPRSGKVRGATYALIALSALSLFSALYAFGVARNVAALDRAAFARHVDGVKDAVNPIERIPRAPDTFIHQSAPEWTGIAFPLGLLASVILAGVSAARIRSERKSPDFRLGSAAGAEFQLSSETLDGADSFPLVQSSGNGWRVHFRSHWRGDLTSDGRVETLSDLANSNSARGSTTVSGAHEITLAPGARFKLQLGATTFLVSSVLSPRRHPVSALANLDRRFLAYLSGSIFAAATLLGVLWAIPPDQGRVSLDHIPKPVVSAELRMKALDAVEDLANEKVTADKAEVGRAGEKQMGPEGKMGKQNYRGPEGHYTIQDRGAEKGLAMKRATEMGESAGIVGVIRRMDGDAFGSVTGQMAFSSGIGQRDIEGGLNGDHEGEATGGYGFGQRFGGWGGGGGGRGTLGLNTFGTQGWCDMSETCNSDVTGVGVSPNGERRPRRKGPGTTLGPVEGVGDLDREMIRREIRKNKQALEYCYEKQLLVKPNLEGTVSTSFSILPTGQVRGAQASGVDGAVSKCVAGVLSQIQFPSPSGGGIVKVSSYPFTFRKSGD